MPMARNRPFIRVAAAMAADRVPPPTTTDSAANCAEPAKTNAEDATAWRAENPAWRATTPKDIDRTKPTVA